MSSFAFPDAYWAQSGIADVETVASLLQNLSVKDPNAFLTDMRDEQCAVVLIIFVHFMVAAA